MKSSGNPSLDQPIINLSKVDKWTIRQAVEGVQIFGGIGSGKTSGSGRMLALKYLSLGFGGLILTVKPDERALWEEYCKEIGREDDLIIIEPEGDFKFNFLHYEAHRADKGAGITDNIVQVLKTVIKAGNPESSNDDAFWENALDMLLFHLIELCQLSGQPLDVDLLYELSQSIPNSRDQLADENWYEETAFGKVITSIEKRLDKDQLTKEEIRIFSNVQEFFTGHFLHLSEKTRSIIEYSLMGFLFRLVREPIYSTFCKGVSNVIPEDCLSGSIILVDFPVKVYDKVGRDMQILFKYIWQRAMERRDIIVDGGRPVFLWADEAQNFIHEHDIDYQATARSSRVCTVYITQNMPNYLAHLGGKSGEYRIQSFLGTLGTKIFHANADYETNHYASKLIGQDYRLQVSESVTMSGQMSTSQSEQEQLAFLVRPEEFVTLKTGSPVHEFIVEGFIHKQGMAFNETGRNHIKAKFNQTYKPT